MVQYILYGIERAREQKRETTRAKSSINKHISSRSSVAAGRNSRFDSKIQRLKGFLSDFKASYST